jgi:hypothetical protein
MKLYLATASTVIALATIAAVSAEAANVLTIGQRPAG